MKGFPKHIGTVQDFKNLLSDDGFKKQALSVLSEIYNLDDSKTTRATTLIDPEDPQSDWNTEVIDNPMPLWKQKGFESRQAVADLFGFVKAAK